MTWHTILGMDIDSKGRGERVSSALRAALALAALGLPWLGGGCGGGGKKVQLLLTAPSDGQVLTSDDDNDIDKPGVQFDITGSSKGIKVGTTVNLFIDNTMQAGDAHVEADGAVHMSGVTLLPGEHSIYLETSTGSTSSNHDQKYTLKALVITAPDNGATLTSADDTDSKTDGVQIDVTVNAYGTDPTAKIALMLDGKMADMKAATSDKATFSGVTLSVGKHTLQAQVVDGSKTIKSGEVKIELQQACAALNFVEPAAPASGSSLTLGGPGQCPSSGNSFTTTVKISTDAGDGKSVQLFVNQQPGPTAKVQGATATFEGVVLSNRTSANTLEVQTEDGAGHTCRAKFPADILVDCAGPDCTIDSPMPVSYVDASGAATLFLNHSLTSSGGSGFDIKVASSAEAVGQAVELVLDGNTRKSLKSNAVADGKGASALFAAVPLADGSHTVQAVCTDASGNQTLTDELTWVADVTPCSVDISAPAAATDFVPADDADANTAGTQVTVTSSVSGGDCSGKRAAVCDPATGISGVDFVSYDGTSPLHSDITLEQGTLDQTLCVDIQDHAGNTGHASVAVTYHGTTPGVLIESPADGQKVNVNGNGTGYIKDAVASTTLCDADFSIACTEVGTDVVLHRGNASGTVIGTATCAAPGSGDPALPSGYNGRAKLTAQFDNGSSPDATVVATQTLNGTSHAALQGASDPLTLHGDCKAPVLALQSDPCSVATSNQISLQQAAARDITVIDNTADTVSFVATATHSGGSAVTLTPSSTPSDAAANYNAVDLGGVGSTTIAVDATDDFNNAAHVECTADIVNDLPVLVFTSPADGDMFGPGSGCGTTMFSVPIVATADKNTARVAKVTVNGTDAATGIVPTGTNHDITACVPVSDGGNDIEVFLTATGAGGGTVHYKHSIHVDRATTTGPADSAVLTSANNCASSGFGIQVTVSVDPSLDNTAFMIASGTDTVSGTVSGNQVTGCVKLAEGPNTITTTVGGTVMSSVNVVVANALPSAGITIATPTSDPASPNYRKGVTASWTKPTADWTGQLIGYQMRCADAPLASGANMSDQNTWWNSASPVSLPPDLVPSTANPSTLLAMRPAEPRNCVVRVEDIAHQLGPIVQSTDLTLKFRQAHVADGTGAVYLGSTVTAVGDVDNDGAADFLVGGYGEAQLLFGGKGDVAGIQHVTFTGGNLGVGAGVAGIGDFNNDQIDDFAIADSASPGRVSIYFGRSQTAWAAIAAQNPLNIETSCKADLCLEGIASAGGITLASIGDFDHDLIPDFAIGAPYLSSGDGELEIVLGQNYEVRTCGANTDCATGETCGGGGTCTKGSGPFWNLTYEFATGEWSNSQSGTTPALRGFLLPATSGQQGNLGVAIAGVGNFDGATGDDVVVTIPGVNAIHFLSGRAHGASPGMTALTPSNFGPPVAAAGQPIATSTNSGAYFGFSVAAVGNLYDASPNAGIPDIAIGQTVSDDMFVCTGDAIKTSVPVALANDIDVKGNGDIGSTIGLGQHPVFDLIGDLDGDGKGDLLAGAGIGTDVTIFYADRFAAGLSSGIVNKNTSAAVVTSNYQVSDTSGIVPQYVGDVNGDGYLDIVFGDFLAHSGNGQIVVLY